AGVQGYGHGRGVGGDDVVVLILDLHDRLGREGGAGSCPGGLSSDDEFGGRGGRDGEGGRVGGGEGAVGEVQGLGVGGVVDAQAGEGGDAGDRGLGQGALERAGAGTERDGHRGGVRGDDVVVLVLDLHDRLGREGGA